MPDVEARLVHVRGVVQGVGFRPFVYRLARDHALAGWVLNEERGVEIHVEGVEPQLASFLRQLSANSPAAASIRSLDVRSAQPVGVSDFEIRASERRRAPLAAVSPDLAICERCLAELFDSQAHRFGYPYINCTDCGPRYSILLDLPYDRSNTTMARWEMDPYCASQYRDPRDRRFHAQPVACPECGPTYYLDTDGARTADGAAAIAQAARMLRQGVIVAIKGIGGYHLACDARNAIAIESLRSRKFRKEKPFAMMAANLTVARQVARLSTAAEELLLSPARPIVLAPARAEIDGVAPGASEIGIMLPYAPLHHLLFAAGAPELLVMTSANRSSEPIAYLDDDARERLHGIADALLIGERPIARRVDDSVARACVLGPMILRRSRGYAPGIVAHLPVERPILAVGADLKNAVALSIRGEVLASPHIGDLQHHGAVTAFRETIRDLLRMYDLHVEDLLVVHDGHPQYRSTQFALELPAARHVSVQHHRAHIASVLAELGAWDRRVLGVALDGTGYGDDGHIWGGEIFCGSVADGVRRVAHLRESALVGGDAAAQHPVQAAAGFLAQLEELPDLLAPPFDFPKRYRDAVKLLETGVRTFRTTSMGRLFDAAAALLGFTREVTFEGQAAMWLESMARKASGPVAPYSLPFSEGELDFRPLVADVCHDRLNGREPAAIARAFHRGIAGGFALALRQLSSVEHVDGVVLSGGVFQNELLLHDLREELADGPPIWTNHLVPPNDGGICLGQAALAALEYGDA